LVTADLTPELASRGGANDVLDADLPMLAAQWLIDGWDSDLLRDLAAMSREEARGGARRRLAAVLASLGFELRPIATSPWEELPWRGYWGLIAWARDEIDRRLSPYAAAQRVLEVVGDVPELWEPGRGEALMSLLQEWDARPVRRDGLDDDIRALLGSLRADQVPPLLDVPPTI
jgi:hypothetical protein